MSEEEVFLLSAANFNCCTCVILLAACGFPGVAPADLGLLSASVPDVAALLMLGPAEVAP